MLALAFLIVCMDSCAFACVSQCLYGPACACASQRLYGLLRLRLCFSVFVWTLVLALAFLCVCMDSCQLCLRFSVVLTLVLRLCFSVFVWTPLCLPQRFSVFVSILVLAFLKKLESKEGRKSTEGGREDRRDLLTPLAFPGIARLTSLKRLRCGLETGEERELIGDWSSLKRGRGGGGPGVQGAVKFLLAFQLLS